MRLLSLLLIAFGTCQKGLPSPPDVSNVAPPPPPPKVVEIAAPASPPPAPPPLALQAEAPIIALAVERFAAAQVSVPIGVTSARPVVVATHGNYDRPEWQCEVWREIVEDRAFVLCPRGEARSDSPAKGDVRFTYASNRALEQEILAGLAALRSRFGAFVDEGPVLYAGFSLGAIMGVSIAARLPARFERLVLVEGGHDKWTPENVQAFRKGGGKRVLFVCSQSACGVLAKGVAERLRAQGVEVKIALGPPGGHRYDGPVAEAAKGALDWIVEGDARFGSASTASAHTSP